MGPSELSRTRLLLALVAGAVAGAFSMAMVGFLEVTMQGFVEAFLWTLWLLVFTVPIAVLIGVPAFGILRSRGLLNPAAVCVTGLLAGLATQGVLYTISGQSIPLGFLVLGGFGGLVAGGVASLLLFWRSNHTIDP
jgi:hypothetical protein